MKRTTLAVLLTLGVGASAFAASPAWWAAPAPRPAAPSLLEVGKNPPPNPAIDADGYLAVAKEAAEHRKTHRVTEEEFIRMGREKGTIILDARSQAMYDLKHVKGAINLPFPDISIEGLKRTLPDKNARILIYCNNNFTDPRKPAGKGVDARAFEGKRKTMSLNVPTFIALYDYGYRNVYELAPLIDPKDSKIEFVVATEGK